MIVDESVYMEWNANKREPKPQAAKRELPTFFPSD
jgi:hypothetical protein